jgi:Right handed beta helix region
VGDRVCVLNKEGAPLGESRVKSINQRKEFTPPDTSFHAFKESRNFFELELDAPVSGTGVESFTCNLDTLGNGYVLRGNTIRNHRARGMLLKAEDGLVENNLIDGSTISGIVLNPEIWWAEAGYSRRVTVRGNTIRRCGYAMTGTWTTQAGALTVYAAGPGPDAIGHDQLVIENNIFENNTGVNMLLDGLKNSRVSGNRFMQSQQEATRRGAQYVDPGALIFIGRCDGLKLENNHTTKPGAAGTVFLKCSPQAKNVEGAEDGIKVEP